MTLLKQAALTIIVGAICFSAGKFLSPAKVELKEVVKVEYRERTDTTKKTDKKETIRPDGTRIIVTTTETKRTTDKSKDTQSLSETKATARPDWHITATYTPKLYGSSVQTYGLGIQRRLFAEVYAGAYVTSDKTIGIALSIGF